MADAPLIELASLRFAYPGQAPLFEDLKLHLRPGECVALQGENGSGKSTLFDLILGLQKAQAGTICLFGQRVERERDFQPFRGRIGLLFQQPALQLFCPSVLEELCFGPLNLGLTRTEAVDRAQHQLARLGIEHLADRPGYRLSGGEQRRVALASVLTMEPEVLLLDEPSNDLDAAGRDALLELLHALPQSKLLISHDPVLVNALASRRLLLAQGQLTEEHALDG